MSCDLKETENKWPCLLAACTQQQQTLESFENGLWFEGNWESSRKAMSGSSTHRTRKTLESLRQTGCDLNNIENNEPFMLVVYVGGTQSLYYDILYFFWFRIFIVFTLKFKNSQNSHKKSLKVMIENLSKKHKHFQIYISNHR